MSTSKGERKRLRKEMVRKAERRRSVAFRATVVGVVVSLVGLAVVAASALLGHSMVAIWAGGPTGVVILATAGVLVARRVLSRGQGPVVAILGWGGMVLTTITGLQLLIALGLQLDGQVESAHSVGVFTVLPAVLAVALVGAELAKNVRGGDGRVHISNVYFH